MPNTAKTLSALAPLQQTLQHAETSCIKCGFCLPTCPTYRLTSNEAASPRGRIALMQAVAAGELEAREVFAPLDFCLGCRACETACPAGVEFGKLLEAGRAVTRRWSTTSPLGRGLQHLFLRTILPSRRRLRLLSIFLRLYQSSGLQALLRRSGLLSSIAPKLATMEAFLPRRPARTARRRLAVQTQPRGQERGQVALLTGCIVPVLLPEVNHATVQVLTENGYRVVAPTQQRCCGALQAHAGDLQTARLLARHNIAIFEATKASFIVVNSAGCGALLKTYDHLLVDDPAFATRAATFSSRVRDISELLATAPLRGPLQALPLRVAYDDPCHLLHGQKIRWQPRDLLSQVPRLQLLEVPESDWCCGSAGIYNLLHQDTAQELLDRKMRHIAGVKPQLIVTGNPGCLLQLRQGVRQHDLAAEVLHPVEVLARAYGNGVRTV